MKRDLFTFQKRRASSLVVTLLVIVVLSTIVVAFMQSMSIERMTAKSVRNRVQADLAADAGIAAANRLVTDLFSRYPDSATAWQTLQAGPTTEGTVFYFRAQPIANVSATNLPGATNSAAYNSTPGNPLTVQTYGWPLISGAAPAVGNSLNSAFSSAFTSSNSVDLNYRNGIGTTPGQAQKQLLAQWLYLTNNQGVTNARYAYWIDDESFKVNVSLAGDTLRGATSLGTNASEIPLQGILSAATNISSPDSTAATIKTIRQSFPGDLLPSYLSISQASTLEGTNAIGDQLKFVATANSSTLNVSRSGFKRVNINNIFTDGSNPRTQLDRFITTVTNSNAAPLFGERFYRDSTSMSSLIINRTTDVSAANSQMYMQRLAANVKDYIDSDSQPTIISNSPGFPLVPAGTPTEGIEPAGGGTIGDNPAAAIGKENVPMLQEYVIRCRLIQLNPAGWSNSNPGSAAFQFSADHYFEFWNMGTKDIYATSNPVSADAVNLGADAFLKLYNQPGYDSVSPAIPEGREFTIPLDSIPNLRFKAGEVTVITTDPDLNTTLIPAGANVFQYTLPNSDRLYSGNTTASSGGTSYKVKDGSGNVIFNNSFQVVAHSRTTPITDYETCYLLGNGSGLIDSFCALPVGNTASGASGMRMNLLTPDRIASDPNSVQYFARGASLYGNGSTVGRIATSGDPRTANEQLKLAIYDNTISTDVTRYYNSMTDGGVPGTSTLGTQNANYVNPNNWPDYSLASSSAATAPMFIADSSMRTIGEFGNLPDPVRVNGASGNIIYSRGGGSTMHVGQPEIWSTATNPSGLWDGEPDSASRTWAAWRLTDFFDTSTNSVIDGPININGIKRDNGIALKAMLKGFTFQAPNEGAPTVSGNTLTDTQLNNLAASVLSRFNNIDAISSSDDMPFWERGEFSEIPIFQASPSLAGTDMAQIIDRGREELARRSINLITTKGNTFTVYVVGQAISVGATGKIKTLSTAKARQTFQILNDQFSAASDAFDPTDATQVANRFSPQTNYYSKPIWSASE